MCCDGCVGVVMGVQAWLWMCGHGDVCVGVVLGVRAW